MDTNKKSEDVFEKADTDSYVCIDCGRSFWAEPGLRFPRCSKCHAAYKLVCAENIKKREEEENRRKKEIQLEKIPLKLRGINTDKTELLDKYTKNYTTLFITGLPGTGKSVFMASFAKKVIDEGYSIKWINFPGFIMELQSQFRDDKQDPFSTAQNVASYGGCLFIDDLGAEKLTDYVRQITYYILNERELLKLPTWITSNFSLSEIDALIDKRISSRISGVCKAIKFTGADRRIRKKE